MTNTTTLPDTLATIERGRTVPSFMMEVGMYAWHEGAFRRVVAVERTSIKFAGVRKHLRTTVGGSCEVAR